MSATAFEKRLRQEYSASPVEQFEKLGERLLLADYDKTSAAHVLSAIARKKDYKSCLLIVQNAQVALAYQKLLAPQMGEFRTITSGRDVQSYFASLSTGAQDLPTAAAKLRETAKNLIVALEDGEQPVLHAPIKKDVTLATLLAEADYEFVVVDDVRDHLCFADDPDGRLDFPADKFERLCFLGKPYYIKRAMSYKALYAITTRAKGCVAITDLLANTDAVELYAALNLLFAGFSPLTVREQVRASAGSFSMDGAYGYDGACSMLYDAITYARCEDTIVSVCLQRVKGTSQRVPADMEAMRRFLMAETDFMSAEEIFLHVMHAHMEKKTGGKPPVITSVIEAMLNSPEDAALPFLHTFFNDAIKAEIEPQLRTTYVFEMSVAEQTALLRLFEKYGSYHYLQNAPERSIPVRLKRDDSGFEYFTRRFHKNDVEDAHCFAVLGKSNDSVCRMMAARHLTRSFGDAVKATAPLLLVAGKNNPTLADHVRRTLIGFTTFATLRDYLCADNPPAKSAILSDRREFLRAPFATTLGGVIFLDVCPEIVTQKLLLAKALASTNGNVYLIGTYSTPEGVLLDTWQKEIKQEDRMLPFGMTEVAPKRATRFAYADILSRYAEFFAALDEAVTNGNRDKAKPLPGMVHDLMVEYGTDPTYPPEIVGMDIAYAAKLGQHYNGVFRNTASIGADCEHLLAQSIETPAGKKATPTAPVETTCALYNTCAAMLRRNCDLTKNNCADCEHFSQFMCNDINALSEATDKFFTLAKEFATKREKLMFEISSDDIIHSNADDEEVGVDLAAAVTTNKQGATNAITQLERASRAMPRIFHADRDSTMRLRECVYQTYRLILRKYYKSVMSVLENATASSKKELSEMREAIAALGKA